MARLLTKQTHFALGPFSTGKSKLEAAKVGGGSQDLHPEAVEEGGEKMGMKKESRTSQEDPSCPGQ